MIAFHIADHAQRLARLATEAWQSDYREGAAAWRLDRRETVSAGRGHPVVLLHGFVGTPQMLRPLGRFVRTRLGRRTLQLPLGLGFGDLRDTALRVHALLEESGVERCDVVGYSLGGIVAAYLLKCLDQGRRIRGVITLGSPHRGVPVVSRWPGLIARCWRSGAQLQAGSPLLESLLRLPMPADTRLLSIAGAADRLVPPSAARLEGPACRSWVVPGVGHLSLLTSRRVYRHVTRGLGGPRARGVRPHAVPKAEGMAGGEIGEGPRRDAVAASG